MINVHGHIFDFRFVPERFIILSKWILKKPRRFNTVAWIMRKLIPFTERDVLEKYARFVKTMGKDQFQILKLWESNYPHGTLFCPLTVDLENMGRGATKEPYITQVNEVLELTRESNNLLPFIMVDPRSKHLNDLYKVFEENIKIIAGMKLYPLVGYYAYDERLTPFYALLNKHKKAVVLHCTPKNAVYYSDDDIDELLDKNCPYYYDGKNNKMKAGNFAHPYHTVKVAEQYKDINFNLAHFGGCDAWRDYIIHSIGQNSNIYTDISFSYARKREQKRLKLLIKKYPLLAERLLYGDDEYMVRTKVHGISFYTQIEDSLGTAMFERISDVNARMYLRI